MLSKIKIIVHVPGNLIARSILLSQYILMTNVYFFIERKRFLIDIFYSIFYKSHSHRELLVFSMAVNLYD